jgi:hypothetical protein
MLSSFFSRLAFASSLLGRLALAAPLDGHDYLPGPHGIYDVYPVEVVINKPTEVVLYCPENTIYPINENFCVTVTDAPTTISTQITQTSILRTQTSMLVPPSHNK